MDKTTEQNWRAQLDKMQAALTHEDALGQDGRRTVTLDQQSVGRLSRMDALQQQAMAQATQARRNQMAQRIRAAIERLEMGEFGYCVTCGEAIARARLDLDPTAATCISCARS